MTGCSEGDRRIKEGGGGWVDVIMDVGRIEGMLEQQ